MTLDVIVSSEWDGRRRTLIANNCHYCDNKFYAPKHTGAKFCSTSCAKLASRRKITLICSRCSTTFKRVPSHGSERTKSGLIFCGRKCKEITQSIGGDPSIRPEHYRDGIASYRRRAISAYGAMCSICNYDADHRMLDVDHVDGNRRNNKISNLQVLCVWCHALKTRGVYTHDRVGQMIKRLAEQQLSTVSSVG